MIPHRRADDPAAIEIHDGGQIEPALPGFDVSDVGESDLVRRLGSEAPIEQVDTDRQAETTVGDPHPRVAVP